MNEQLKKKILSGGDLFNHIFGQNKVKKQFSSVLLSNRHVIIVGSPGIGKTTLAKNVAELLPELTVNDCGFNCLPGKPNCPSCMEASSKDKSKSKAKTINVKGIDRFIRIQGSPDLTAEDLLGDIDPLKAMKFGPLSLEAFNPGKIFKANNGILFFDEVNRAPEKLQNALLQVLEEGKVTIGSYEVDFNANFILIATMNPRDINTERLSDVFTDRFDYIYMDYPDSIDLEQKIVLEKGTYLGVKFPFELLRHALLFVRELRENKDLEKIPSVRASLGLYERAQANALLNNNSEVKYEDFKDAIFSVLNHRIALKPSQKFLQSTDDFLNREFESYSEKHKLGHEG